MRKPAVTLKLKAQDALKNSELLTAMSGCGPVAGAVKSAEMLEKRLMPRVYPTNGVNRTREKKNRCPPSTPQ